MMKNVNVGYRAIGLTQLFPTENTNLKLSDTRINLQPGQQYQLTIKSEYEETPTWYSSNEKIVKVDQNGLVEGITPGQTHVSAISGKLKGTCLVNVIKPIIHVTEVTLDQSSLTLNVGETAQLIATILPESADNKKVIWRSSNSTIVSVSSKGIVTAKNSGNATIEVISEDGGYKASCTINVIEKITLDESKIYYGSIPLSNLSESFDSFNDLTEQDIINITQSGILNTTNVSPFEATLNIGDNGELVTILIPTDKYKAYKDNGFGTKKVFDEVSTGLNVEANGDIKLGNFYIYGELYISSGKLKIYVE